MNYWPLVGVAIVVLGFALRRNPALVVVVAGLASGIAAGKPLGELLELLGTAFVANRTLLLFVLTLPVIGLLERHGLRDRARGWIASFRSLTLSRLLVCYLGLRQLLSMFGLIDLAGHAQTVRPLLAPMAEGAAVNAYGEDLPQPIRDKIKAHAAACDNIAVFFGEDIFIAFGAVLLMDAFLKENGITNIEPLHIGLWAIPTALSALVIHMFRLTRLDASIRRDVDAWKAGQNDSSKVAA